MLGDEDPDTVENVDGFVDLDNGTTRSFTVSTLAEAARLITKREQTGESGAHIRVPDLVLLQAGGVASIVAAVDELADDLPIVELN